MDHTHDPRATPPGAPSPCAGCATRRVFLRDSLALATGVALLGAPLELLRALPGGSTHALRYPLPAADGASIDADNEVILVRVAGGVYAFALSCPHQNTALKALPRNGGFQCTRHKSKYRPTGEFISGRATRHMDRLAIAREGEVVVVDPATAFESDTNPAGWAAAKVAV